MDITTTKTKTTKGKQKIEIKFIENYSTRIVTFTKRRRGLFNKAAELCILTGADMAIIVKSPGRRSFAFGHPSVEAVVDRYLGVEKEDQDLGVTDDVVRVYRERYDAVAKELEVEKKRANVIMGSVSVANNPFWWEGPIDGLAIEELDSYVAALEELKKKVATRADEMQMLMRDSIPMHYASSPPLAMNQMSNENTVESAYNFIDQQQPLDNSASIHSLVPLGSEFGHGHVAYGSSNCNF